ncbi:hypothetical protein [Lactococcus garvieae]
MTKEISIEVDVKNADKLKDLSQRLQEELKQVNKTINEIQEIKLELKV